MVMTLEKLIAEEFFTVEATVPADNRLKREQELFREGVRLGLRIAKETDMLASKIDMVAPDIVTHEGW